ncbi:MAG: hypothetical protein RMZ42_31405 [Nostoc sp. DedQUE05]|uniref:hypothetical protein n=1 Tax=Nostoc sp. DedQUE05 TaxID=3075391 RepID=UPI002AD36BA7|nr:hypothetical protein [Nostoc sp. DedQUE05]MDZ8096410.1 hypothetical protein [Nostoc sp. DedQUE05]
MTQKTCPQCDCTTLRYQGNYGYWECLDCGHVWALDADDPDYGDSITYVYQDTSLCGTCNGGGLIQEEGELLCCPNCDGTGSIG